MDLKQAFGRRIKTLREQRGLNQNDLAEATERSTDAISMIERGLNWPSVETVERLSAALDVPTSDLFDDLAGADRSAGPDLVITARELIRKLSRRDLEVAVATLEALVKNAGQKRR